MQAYVSIDLETTGLNPKTCQVLEFGAVIDDGREDVTTLPKFRAILKWDEIFGEPYALSMHPALFKAIATIPEVPAALTQDATTVADPELDPLDPVNCMRKPSDLVPLFLSFLQKHGIDTKKGFQPAGKNFASFDRPFLESGVPRWKNDVKIKHRTIDPGNLFWYPGEEFVPDTKTCYQRAGLPEVVAHTAVEDALGVVLLVRAWREQRRCEARLAKQGRDFIEAFGKLQAALHPSLIVDINNPVAMADAIIRYQKEGLPGDN